MAITFQFETDIDTRQVRAEQLGILCLRSGVVRIIFTPEGMKLLVQSSAVGKDVLILDDQEFFKFR